MTKTAVAAQDEERKAFMGSIRDCLASKVRAGQEWHGVIGRHTHPGSIWHFADRDAAVQFCRISSLSLAGNCSNMWRLARVNGKIFTKNILSLFFS